MNPVSSKLKPYPKAQMNFVYVAYSVCNTKEIQKIVTFVTYIL